MPIGRDPVNGQILPGFSGNPLGRPKGRKITDEIDTLLAEEDPESDGKTRAQLLAAAILKHALKGDARYAAMVMDRIEGKVPDIVITKGLDDMSTEELAKALRGVADAVDPPPADTMGQRFGGDNGTPE